MRTSGKVAYRKAQCLETLYLYRHLQSFYFSTLDIKTTHSTWVEFMELMSTGRFKNHLYVGTCQFVFQQFLKNRRSREHVYGTILL